MRAPALRPIGFPCRARGALALSLAFCCAMAQAAPVTHTVRIEGMRFSPQVLQVRRGDTIEWINQDPFPHDAVSTARGFRSTVMAPDARWKFVARRKGDFAYRCTLHPMMTASVIVR
jgi:plastocyanin